MIKLCINDGKNACSVCGVPFAGNSVRNCPAKPWKYGVRARLVQDTRLKLPKPKPLVPGLGDAFQKFLETHGITKERYILVKNLVGLDPSCNCEKRRQAMNEIGHKLGLDNLAAKYFRWAKSRSKKT